jgi:hypothetical protein
MPDKNEASRNGDIRPPQNSRDEAFGSLQLKLVFDDASVAGTRDDVHRPKS